MITQQKLPCTNKFKVDRQCSSDKKICPNVHCSLMSGQNFEAKRHKSSQPAPYRYHSFVGNRYDGNSLQNVGLRIGRRTFVFGNQRFGDNICWSNVVKCKWSE
jgi:hypothetical protein